MSIQAAVPALINAGHNSETNNWVFYAGWFALFGLIGIFKAAMDGEGRPDPLPPEPEATVIDPKGDVIAVIEAPRPKPITSAARRLGRWVGARRAR